MDRLKKQRTPIRAMMTRTVNELDEEMTKEDKDKDVLIVKLKKLIELTDTAVDLDKQVLDAILDNEELTEEDYLEESRSIDGYNDKCRFVRHKVEKFLGPERSSSPTNSSYSTASGGLLKKNYKLPKIELMKFDGEIKNWLEWWAQFKKIDEDEDLHVTDKFHYLVQSMVSGSKAADLIRSYPKTDANYPKAMGALKERYGKEDILVDLYTKELAQFLFEKERLSLEKFYDRLQTQLQALESLGVKSERDTLFLRPIIETCLPKEIFNAWYRSPLYQEDGAKVNPPRSRLDYLMQFVRQEVEREAKLKMFIGGDSSGKSKKEKYENHGKKKDSIPTAAGLFVAQSSNCVFCSKSNHPSTECYRADRMSCSEKSDLIRSQNLCYRCLKYGHRKSDCKVKLKCSSCGKPHARSMCARLPSNQRNNTGREEVHNEVPATAANANHSCSKDVLMKTLLVKMAGPKGTRIVRLLFDEGSQQSRGGQRTISAIGSPLVGEEWTVMFCLVGF
ncbi:ATP-dependent RNA helicase glh-3 [Folsomia candida]|uniref:ATP-dependent RNA helicase glh-3 n=1 Tax=Folsomia candida TaxID=158441 RepID=A0A226DBH8_FOLCA|nr:ATP-dependent RNA helicase glh-3 [Folsomia candida]